MLPRNAGIPSLWGAVGNCLCLRNHEAKVNTFHCYAENWLCRRSPPHVGLLTHLRAPFYFSNLLLIQVRAVFLRGFGVHKPGTILSATGPMSPIHFHGVTL